MMCRQTDMRLRFVVLGGSGKLSTGKNTPQLMTPMMVKTAAGSKESSSHPASSGPTT